MKRKEHHHQRIVKAAVLFIPFVVGLIGFLLAGYSIDEATYNAFSLYFVVRENGEFINVWIFIAQYMAPIFLVGGFFIAIFSWSKSIRDWWLCLLNDDVAAVYGDTKEANELASRTTHGTYREEKILEKADKHVIMFSSEQKSIDFYRRNMSIMNQKKTFVMLSKLDASMINNDNTNSDGNSNSTFFFNTDELIARAFWKDERIINYFLENDSSMIDIAIIGFNALGKKILNYGLLDNIYSAKQHITYHVWGDSELFQSTHPNLNDQLIDGEISDSIIYYGPSLLSNIEILPNVDIVILCEEDNVAYAETIINICSNNNHIYWYNSGETGYDSILLCNNLKSFGKCCYDLSVDGIEREAMYKMAKALDNEYGRLYGAFSWNKSGFDRESNIAATDYHYIRERILSHGNNLTIDDDYIKDLCRLEHVRWERFHYLNYWTNDGVTKKKDRERKIHPDLIPYDSLDQNEQYKDAEIIKILLQLFANQEDACLSDNRRNELISSLEKYSS